MVQKIPLLKIRAGPRDGPKWIDRLKEEYQALITVIYIYYNIIIKIIIYILF